MKLFLDANILVAVLNNEIPTFSYAARILSLPTFRRDFSIHTTPICLAIAYYFAEKKCGSKKALEKMKILSSQINIISIGQEEVNMTNNNKKITDFEDGLQYYAALKVGCTVIISENTKDFYFSEIPVHSSKDFILNVL